jgi:ADP-ribosyl-[dinitrogen reductase] hydrolase
MPLPHAAFIDSLRSVTLGEPRTWGGLTVFPLLAADSRAPAYDMFGFACDAGGFRLTEVSAGGVVGRLRAENERDRPVLLLDGEEVTGAKQNRIINLTILVPAHTTLDIPVSCVEQGRWNLKSQAFSAAERTMFSRGRARKMRNVTASLRTRGSAEADQRDVWNAVAMELRDAGAVSDTGAMSALYEQNAEDVESCVAAFQPVPQQVGAVFGVNGSITGAELFDAHEAYAASAAKVVRSYGIELRRAHAGPPATEAAAAAFIDALCAVTPTSHATTGAGVQLRLEGDGVLGAALVHEDRVIHMTAFRSDHPGSDGSDGSDASPGAAGDGRGPRARHLIDAGAMRCRAGRTFERTPAPVLHDAGTLRGRVAGMLLGLAVGDALGNTTEGMTPAQRRAAHGEIRDYLPNRHAAGYRVGVPSCETQHAFWTLRRLLEDDGLEPDRLAHEFCSHRSFGIGRAMRGFIRAHRDQRQPWQESGQPSAGNGALARVAPVLLPHLRAPSPALWDDAAVATMITHNEPAAIGSCIALTDVLWQCLGLAAQPEPGWWLRTFVATLSEIEGSAARYRPRAPHLAGPVSLASFTAHHVRHALDHDLDTAAACDGWHSGTYLLETVPSVIYILERHAHDPEEAIIRAVNDTKDNDTVAAVVGAAVGALHGAAALPTRWIEALSGRTREHDDGEIFRLVDAACRQFAG